MTQPLAERLWDKIAGPWVAGVDVDDCWLWKAHSNSTYGYGRIRFGGRGTPMVLAHREVFRQVYRKLKPKEVVRHKCDLPLCCNPLHLRAGTQAENVADKFRVKTIRRFKRRNRRHDLWRNPTPEDYFEAETAV